jgi:tetratricopeptide (TPR) repeat protein
MKIFRSGISVGLVVAMASLSVIPQPRVLAQDVLGISQDLSVSNYLLAQSSADPYVLLELVTAYLEAKNFYQALATANRISDPYWQSQALSGIAHTYAKSGNIDQANKLLGQALTVTNRISDPNVQSNVMFEIVQAYVETGNIDQALAVANQIKNSYSRLKTLNSIRKKQN